MPWPVIGLLIAITFGECIAMDFKKFQGIHLLHLIDYATRLSACAIVQSKRPEKTIEKIFCIWISNYMVAPKNSLVIKVGSSLTKLLGNFVKKN